MRKALKSPAFGSLFNESVTHGEQLLWDVGVGRLA